ncbi:MAG TPA: haloacid dehalogenase type II [Alphaproteobacteria bacterium]|nr:haloacid dehalogenase type II [Alphaproteobacteria bacterium]
MLRRLTDFTTLTFDCYGTLIDWERGILAELRPWAARYGIRADDDTLLTAFGEAEAACEAATPGKLYPAILGDVLGRLAERWNVPLEPQDAVAFGGSVGRWPVFPDSVEALQYLKAHFKLVIISNVDRASFAKSRERLGVVFDRVITAEDVGSYKPNIRNFEFALADIKKALGVEKPRVLHAAQSIFHDIVPAKSLGLATLWVNRRKGRPGWGATPPPRVDAEAMRPDFEVASLAELTTLHEGALGRGRT